MAVGILADDRGRILVARRPDSKEQAGLWEFPGGKVDHGESVEDALRREFREELQVTIAAARPLIRIPHAYPERRVLLDVWRITHYAGAPQALEGQQLAWSAPRDLDGWRLLAANRPIVRAVQLPSLYAVTDAGRCGEERMLERIAVAARAGLALLQVREKNMDAGRRRRFVEQVLGIVRPRGVRVMLNGDPGEATDLGCDGVHLDAQRLCATASRPLREGLMVGASCHNAHELAAAARVGADFAVLSPVRPTPSHVCTPPLGWEEFAALCDAATLPVYALGGVVPDDLERAWRSGAQGLAMISGLWEAPDIARAVTRSMGRDGE